MRQMRWEESAVESGWLQVASDAKGSRLAYEGQVQAELDLPTVVVLVPRQHLSRRLLTGEGISGHARVGDSVCPSTRLSAL